MYWSRSYYNRQKDLLGTSVERSEVTLPTPQLEGSEGGYILLSEVDRVFLPGVRRPEQILVVRTDPMGEPAWVRRWPHPAVDPVFGSHVCELDNGDLVIAGSSWRNIGNPGIHPSGIEVILACFSSTGFLLWQRKLFDPIAHLSLSSLRSFGNTLTIAGTLTPKALKEFDNKRAWVGAFDGADGSALWQSTFDYGLPTIPTSLSLSDNSEYTIAGNIAPGTPNGDPMVFARRIASDGSLLDERTFLILGRQPSAVALASTAGDTTNVIIGTIPTASTSTTSPPPSSPFAICFDFHDDELTGWTNEYVLWPYEEPELRISLASSASRTLEGDTIVAGSLGTGFEISYFPLGPVVAASSNLVNDAVLLRLRSDDGSVEWVRRYGGKDNDTFRSVLTHAAGAEQEIVVCGRADSFPAQQVIPNCLSSERSWMMRLDRHGDFDGDMSCMDRAVGYEVHALQVTSPRLVSADEQGDVIASSLERESNELDLNVVKLCPARSERPI